MNIQTFNIGKLVVATLVLFSGLLVTKPASLETIADIPVQLVKAVDPKQLACLAKNIYHEAGHESINGQAAVAWVVMNRVRHGFGSTPCNVVFQAINVERETDSGTIEKIKLCQFSWVCEGKGDPNKQSARYKQAEQIAYDVMVHKAYSNILPGTALFFHNMAVNPMWPYRQVAKIGNHIFYSNAKKKNNNDHQ